VPKDEQAGATLAANVRRYRLRAGLSQERLALAADLHINAISFVERGLRDPKISTLLAIARALTTVDPQQPVTVADLVENIEA
jgi:transcriptional regulator with XRE-family HTH domain